MYAGTWVLLAHHRCAGPCFGLALAGRSSCDLRSAPILGHYLSLFGEPCLTAAAPPCCNLQMQSGEMSTCSG